MIIVLLSKKVRINTPFNDYKVTCLWCGKIYYISLDAPIDAIRSYGIKFKCLNSKCQKLLKIENVDGNIQLFPVQNITVYGGPDSNLYRLASLDMDAQEPAPSLSGQIIPPRE